MAGFDATLANLGITRSNAATAATQNTANLGQRSLDQGDFLKLMTAQLKNQDPFEPVDNTQMVAQMAQFSSLAGITDMSSTLKAIADKLGAGSASDALGWVGRTVLTEGTTAYPRTSGGFAGGIEIDAAATEVNLTITDASGNVVRTVALGAQDAGTIDYDWDGTTDSGEAAGAGPFTLKVAAADGTTTVPARTLVWAPVSSVSMSAGGPVLTLPGIGQVSSTAIRSVA